jgi:hypothetical protein
VTDDAPGADVLGFAALTLGLVFVGTAHAGCVQALCQALMCRPVADLDSPLGRLAFLGLGLLFLRKQAAVEATVELVKVRHVCPRPSPLRRERSEPRASRRCCSLDASRYSQRVPLANEPRRRECPCISKM